jgi:hypothetical protein
LQYRDPQALANAVTLYLERGLRRGERVASVCERIQASGRGTTRVCGEMVTVLWQEGKQEAAIARLYPFPLFCSAA